MAGFSGSTWGKVKKYVGKYVDDQISLVTKAIEKVDTLPTTHDVEKLYKLEGQEALWWWNGTEYVEVTNESGMVVCNSLPTTDISYRLLYKLTQNMTHQGATTYVMNAKPYTESETTIDGAITHNTTTNTWYDGTTIITVNSVNVLPDGDSSTYNKYYFVNNSLYKCERYTPTIIDYYAGVYCNISGVWHPLYTSNLAVDYNDIKEESLPKIQGILVKGEHSISDFGALTEEVASAIFQRREMSNPVSGYTATTVEGTLAEMDTKFSSAVRIRGEVEYYADLPSNADAGDMYVVKKDTDDTELNTMYCYNGVTWFEYGSANIDMSPYQKFEQIIQRFIIANPSITFSNASTVAKNDNFILYSIEATLNTPITDIQTPDRAIMNIPSDLNISYKNANVMITTHGGQITSMEDIPSLPSGGDRDYIIPTIGQEFVKSYQRMTHLAFNEVDTLINDGYEYNTTNNKWYYNGTEFTPTKVSTLPEPDLTNNGKYYYIEVNSDLRRLYLSELVEAVVQDYNVITGELLYDANGLPSVASKKNVSQSLSSGSSVEVYILNTDNMSGKDLATAPMSCIGYEEGDTSNIIEVKKVKAPLWRVRKITLVSNTEYIEAVKRKKSNIHINTNGVYGTYKTKESEESSKYSSHGSIDGKCPEGFNGTWEFVPYTNVSSTQMLNRAYITNGKLYVQGNVTIDKFYLEGIVRG